MFLQLAHTKLLVFSSSRKLTLECYRLTKDFPPEERFTLVQQIRRAALSVHLNIAEGSSRKSPGERRRFFEISRGSVIEIDTALDIAIQLGYCTFEQSKILGEILVETFKMLSGLISKE
jgi:four helix bundle protein